MYLIIGYGITGQEAVTFCKSQGISYVIFDDKAVDGQENIYNDVNAIPWESIYRAIISPGVPTWSTLPPVVILCRQKAIPIFSDLDILFHHNGHKKFIGITGSQGKTTIHDAMYKLMVQWGRKPAMGGNNGIGCLSLQGEEYLLEVSMQQLLVSQSIVFNTAIFNNFFDTHQEVGDFNFRLQAKRKILTRMGSCHQIFIVGDFPRGHIHCLGSAIKPQDIIVYSYNFHRWEHVTATNYVFVDYDEIKKIHRIIYNIGHQKGDFLLDSQWAFQLMAEENLGILWAFVVTHGNHNSVIDDGVQQEFIKILTHYEPVDHRCTLCHQKNQWKFFNGSKCTNGFAFQCIVKKIIHNYSGKNYWILGGILNSPVENFMMASLKQDNFYIMGQDGPIIYEHIKDYYPHCILLDNLSQVMVKIHEDLTKEGDGATNIILAPGCQSLDQFKNFEQRGNYFVEIIKNMYN
jgi:UDP-N-acetylmuramoylalanine--D-glutamate ligase